MLLCVALHSTLVPARDQIRSQLIAVGVLQCVTVCCSVAVSRLQCVARWHLHEIRSDQIRSLYIRLYLIRFDVNVCKDMH